MNVLSNIPFVIIGIIGLVIFAKHTDSYLPKTAMICFFIAVVLTGFGSAYYHIEPNNTNLVWDRIPDYYVYVFAVNDYIASYK
jgi:hypothetical protein